MLNKDILGDIKKQLETMQRVCEDLEQNIDSNKVSILYRDNYNHLHKLVIKIEY